MAVAKDLPLDCGITLTYHTIAERTIRRDGSGSVIIHSFVDAKTRKGGFQPAQVRQIDFQMPAAQADTATVADLYTLLKQPGEMEDVPDPADPKKTVPVAKRLPGFLAGGSDC